MTAAHLRTINLICCAAVFTAFAGGCTVGTKSFSIDSNSRIPFFGLELKERKPKSLAPSYSTISQTIDDVPRIEPAIGSAASSSGSALKREDKRRPLARIVGAVNNSFNRAPQIKSEVSEPLALPRTDSVPKTEVVQTVPSVIDFQ